MKKYGLVFFLLTACFFSGCSSNDSETGANSSSGNMLIGVSLPSVSTRVTETADAVKGLITAWESTDSLRVFHKYTQNGTIGSMQGFKFTSAAAGSSTTFKYNGASEYSFTPSSSLYAFNALPTSGNYTKIYSSSNDNFTLSLSGLSSQDGTVSNLKNYDAMYGVSSVVSDGTPSAMSMNHLLSVVRFDVSNTAFSGTLSSVKFTYTATSGSSLLPSFGGFTLSNAGALTTGTLTGATSWSVSNVAVSSGTAPVYLMTFPDTRSGTLTITATDSGGNTYSRTITLSGMTLTSGNMKVYTVTLNAAVAPSSESNSYIVAPGATIYIPVSRATAGNSANFPDGSSFTTGLLWSDVSATHVTPTVSDRYIKVVAGSTEGNSVVYAKNTSGNIVWSWHIWVTNYNPGTTANTGTNTTTYSYNSNLWMDRNLGATTTTAATQTTKGLLYQWGRKDPFPGSTTYNGNTEPTTSNSNLFGEKSAVTLTAAPTGPNVAVSIQDPLTFYFSVSGYRDWYASGIGVQNSTLWNNTDNTKTIYDPCPVGWRVPYFTGSTSPWNGLSTTGGSWSSGFTWSSIGYYPAAGYRGASDGSLSLVGSGGYSWSAMANSIGAYCLYFGSTRVTPSYNNDRACGFSVRCVKN